MHLAEQQVSSITGTLIGLYFPFKILIYCKVLRPAQEICFKNILQLPRMQSFVQALFVQLIYAHTHGRIETSDIVTN